MGVPSHTTVKISQTPRSKHKHERFTVRTEKVTRTRDMSRKDKHDEERCYAEKPSRPLQISKSKYHMSDETTDLTLGGENTFHSAGTGLEGRKTGTLNVC